MAYRRSYGNRRRRSSGRRVMRRSNMYRGRSRRVYSSRRTGYSNVGGSHLNTLGFRNKRFNPRRQSRMNWTASNASAHYRTIGSLSVIGRAAPAVETRMNLSFLPFIDTSFWTTSGGSINNIDLAPDARIFIRGGTSNLRITNVDTDSSVVVRVWCVRTTPNGIFNIVTTPVEAYDIADEVPVAWDPTVHPNFFKWYKVWKSYEFVIKPQDVYTLKRKVLDQRIDASSYDNLNRRDFYIVGINSLDGTTANVSWTADFNVSFSTDAV